MKEKLVLSGVGTLFVLLMVVAADPDWSRLDASDTFSVLALVVALCAFGLAGLNLQLTRRDRRRDLFLTLHRQMLEPDLLAGRKVLVNRVAVPSDISDLRYRDEDAFDAAERTLALFDVFALYARKGYLDADLLLAEWRTPLVRLRPAAMLWVEHRAGEGESAWPNLVWLLGQV